MAATHMVAKSLLKEQLLLLRGNKKCMYSTLHESLLQQDRTSKNICTYEGKMKIIGTVHDFIIYVFMRYYVIKVCNRRTYKDYINMNLTLCAYITAF